MTIDYTVTENADGTIEIRKGNEPRTVLDPDQVRAFVAYGVYRGTLARVLLSLCPQPAQRAVELGVQIIGGLCQGRSAQVAERLGGFLVALNSSVGMRHLREADEGPSPPLRPLLPATAAAENIKRHYTVETAASEVDPDELSQQGNALQIGDHLLRCYEAAFDQTKRNVLPVARAANAAVRDVYAAIEPFLPKDIDLARLAEPLDRFIHDPSDRGQVTKQILNRERERLRKELTSEIYARAKAEAKAELRSQWGDRLDLLTEGTPAPLPKK